MGPLFAWSSLKAEEASGYETCLLSHRIRKKFLIVLIFLMSRYNVSETC